MVQGTWVGLWGRGKVRIPILKPSGVCVKWSWCCHNYHVCVYVGGGGWGVGLSWLWSWCVLRQFRLPPYCPPLSLPSSSFLLIFLLLLLLLLAMKPCSSRQSTPERQVYSFSAFGFWCEIQAPPDPSLIFPREITNQEQAASLSSSCNWQI